VTDLATRGDSDAAKQHERRNREWMLQHSIRVRLLQYRLERRMYECMATHEASPELLLNYLEQIESDEGCCNIRSEGGCCNINQRGDSGCCVIYKNDDHSVSCEQFSTRTGGCVLTASQVA
jgi:hypothetical protein